jgi:hypothetical protein
MPPRLLSLALLAACSPPDLLVDTPISGGTERVQAALREELAAFDEATGFGRTRVSRVRVRDLSKIMGRFDKFDHSVTVDDDLGPAKAAEVLRHELCHSLNQREDHHEDFPALYERLAQGAFASEFAVPDRCTTTRCQHDEMFAAYCTKGPWVAQALAQECPGDPEDGVAILQQLAEDVWTGVELVLPTRTGPEWASIQIDEPAERVRGWPTTSPTVFSLSVHMPTELGGNGDYEVFTGAWVSPVHQDSVLPPTEPPPGLPLTVSGFEEESADSSGARGWTEGPYATTVEIELYDLGLVLRHVWYDGERWWLVEDGCVRADIEPFVVEVGVFTFRPNGVHLGWGPVEP